MKIMIGSAGWTVPKQHRVSFCSTVDGAELSHLELYAGRLPCVEINSSFHRPHRRGTWERWSKVTPDHFRFAVKAPKAITHVARLVNSGGALVEFFGGVRGLGEKLGPVLFQLPPKLLCDEGVAHEFFTTLREVHLGTVVLEPRHASWFTASADRLLRDFEIARVAADPPKGSDLASLPGGWSGIRYWRLHGAPRTYYSNYEEQWLTRFAELLQSRDSPVDDVENWVIFDNTALGHATGNALWLQDAMTVTRKSR